MAKLIAIHTISGMRQSRVPTEAQLDRNPHDKGDFEPVQVAPGEAFDPKSLGISRAEQVALIKAGAVREQGTIAAQAENPAAEVPLHPPAGGGDFDPLLDAEELEGMSRAELDALATERGIDPARARNKGEMIALLTASA